MLTKHFMVRADSATATVFDTATLGEALAQMVKHQRQQLLVYNAENEFVGEITSFTLAKLLLPDEEGKEQTQEEAELETVNDLDDRLRKHLGRKVADFVEHEIPVVGPATPLSEALRLITRGRLRLPVVDPNTKKFVGVLSALTVLRRYQF